MSTVVCTPVKNCALWLPRYLTQLEDLKGISRIIFIYGDSEDSTLLILKNWIKKTRHSVELFKEPSMQALTSAQIGAIYQDFQEIIRQSGKDEWILLADADLMEIPSDTVERLKTLNKDIVAPYVWMRNCVPKLFYDSYVFRLKGYRYHPLRPPMGGGKPLQLDSVGTCFLVKRKVFLDVPYGDPYPHMKFCNDARTKDYEVWADPTTNVNHLDLTRFGIHHYPIEQLLNPGKPMQLVPFIADDGKVVEDANFSDELINAWVYGD